MADITKILLRRDTKVNWDTVNPILGLGEPAVAIENNSIVEFKIGDGYRTWKELPNILEGETSDLTEILNRLSALEEELNGDPLTPNDGLVGEVNRIATEIANPQTGLSALNSKIGANTEALAMKEAIANKVTAMNENSTDTEYPSAKAVYLADERLEDLIDQEALDRNNADNLIKSNIENIESLIPAQASSNNQLADKDFVNSSIATNTATFMGTFNIVEDLGLDISATREEISEALSNVISEPTNNDYCFVAYPDETEPNQFIRYDRYKFNGNIWEYEFTLNNSSFTANQWATINSGLTSEDKAEPFTTAEMETICDDIFYPALPAPANVEVSGTDISFDEVQGATSYIIYANGNEIGEVQA